MTQVLAVDSKNDLYLDSGNNIAVASGLTAILQACETATKAQLAEMLLETGKGIPNFQTVWIGAPNVPLWTSYIRSTLAAVQGVQQVVSLEVFQRGNTLTYTATIKTQFGNAVINGI
jgi:hypothetical protein